MKNNKNKIKKSFDYYITRIELVSFIVIVVAICILGIIYKVLEDTGSKSVILIIFYVFAGLLAIDFLITLVSVCISIHINKVLNNYLQNKDYKKGLDYSIKLSKKHIVGARVIGPYYASCFLFSLNRNEEAVEILLASNLTEWTNKDLAQFSSYFLLFLYYKSIEDTSSIKELYESKYLINKDSYLKVFNRYKEKDKILNNMKLIDDIYNDKTNPYSFNRIKEAIKFPFVEKL